MISTPVIASPQFALVLPKVRSPFLEGLSESEVDEILAAGRKRHYTAGSVISHQGEPAHHAYLLLKGRARFFITTPHGDKILLMWLPEGEAFGGAALHRDPWQYIVSTEAVKDSTVLAWDRATIRRLAYRYPQLLENCIVTAIEYLSFYVASHVALTCHTASQRVAAVLLNLANGIGHAVSRGTELNITNEELAQAANVTHFTASRILSEWQRDGALIKSRGKIVLLSPEKIALASR